MDYDKLHYRRNENGIVRYAPEGDEGDVATLQQRTAIGKFKDGSIYLRVSDAEDLAKAKAAADALGLTYTQRRGGASHFGRTGSYEHLHFGHPQDALSVHAALGYHLEGQGKPADHEAHLQKLSGGMHGHVQGKDARADACMLNSQHAHQMSLDANKADTPDTHRGAAHFHRLCAEAHQAQASRPWTNGQGAHHAGLAILHEAIAQHHDHKAIASQKRIQAEMKRKAEMRARMEAMEEGRETKKAVDGEEYEMPLDEAIQEHERLVKVLESPDHKDDLEEAEDQGEELAEMKEAKKALVHAHTRTVNGRLVQVKEHQDGRASAEQIKEAGQPGPPTYKKAVAENLKHMGTGAHEWEAVPVKGMKVLDTDSGSKMVPEIEWPKGYESAPTLYKGDVSPCCELCGTPIKNVYGIQHHGKKWTLRVGSECVTHFGQGQSGEQLLKKNQQDANREAFNAAMNARKLIEDEYTVPNFKIRLSKKLGKPIPAFQEWKTIEAWKAWKALYDVTTTSSGKDYNTESSQAMTGWVSSNGEKAAKAVSAAGALLGRSFAKNLGTCGVGTDLSTLEGGGALRAEGHDDELADATMVSKAVEPTPAQIESGNYPKKHITVQGLSISIENPKGSIRRGVDKDGHEWESKMAAAYGYFTGVGEARDGDAPDVFVGPDPENPYVHVVNQVDPKTGKYDEMKVMLGYKSREAAIEGYLANYEKGWKGLGDVKTLHIDDFKEWLRNGDITKRLVIKAATTRLHATSRIQMQYLRVHPGSRMSCGFTDAVQAAKGAGLTDAEILRTVSNATGAFAPLVRHLKENQ